MNRYGGGGKGKGRGGYPGRDLSAAALRSLRSAGRRVASGESTATAPDREFRGTQIFRADVRVWMFPLVDCATSYESMDS